MGRIQIQSKHTDPDLKFPCKAVFLTDGHNTYDLLIGRRTDIRHRNSRAVKQENMSKTRRVPTLYVCYI